MVTVVLTVLAIELGKAELDKKRICLLLKFLSLIDRYVSTYTHDKSCDKPLLYYNQKFYLTHLYAIITLNPV